MNVVVDGILRTDQFRFAVKILFLFARILPNWRSGKISYTEFYKSADEPAESGVFWALISDSNGLSGLPQSLARIERFFDVLCPRSERDL